MKNIFSNLTGNNLMVIALIFAVTVIGLTYIITNSKGQLNLCIYKWGISLQIKSNSSLPETKSDRCL